MIKPHKTCTTDMVPFVDLEELRPEEAGAARVLRGYFSMGCPKRYETFSGFWL